MAVPKDIVLAIGKREIKVSLQTTNLHHAKRQLFLVCYQIEQSFCQARGEETDSNLPYMAVSMPKGITFTQLIERYFAAQEHQRLSDTTKQDYSIRFNVLKSILGENQAINQITRDDCRQLQQTIIKLPPNARKRFPKESISQITDIADKQNLPRLAPKTVNQHISCLNILMEWACKERLLDANPARGLLVQETVLLQDKRDPFTTEQLNAIFGSEEMLKYRGEGHGRFWIAMLALWTGARLGEICQLVVEDIRTIDGISVIAIHAGDGNRLKTVSANRLIPIHPRLIDMGFLSYVEYRKERGNQLFSITTDEMSKWFGRYAKAVGVKTPKTCFHSFRHNFRDALREARVDREMVQALGGWKNKSAGTEEVYGKGIGVQQLAKAIITINYRGLNGVR